MCCTCVWASLYQDYVKTTIVDAVTDPWMVLLQCLQIPAEANKPQLVSLWNRPGATLSLDLQSKESTCCT